MITGGDRGDNVLEIIFEIICLFITVGIFSFIINKVG